MEVRMIFAVVTKANIALVQGTVEIIYWIDTESQFDGNNCLIAIEERWEIMQIALSSYTAGKKEKQQKIPYFHKRALIG